VALPKRYHAHTDDPGAQKTAILAARLQVLGITKANFAAIVGVSERTVGNWSAGRTKMNAAADLLLEQIEASADLRCKLGIGEKVKGAPRGKPFEPGNPYRFGDRRRHLWVAGARYGRAAA
jgi:hypothetical protein